MVSSKLSPVILDETHKCQREKVFKIQKMATQNFESVFFTVIATFFMGAFAIGGVVLFCLYEQSAFVFFMTLFFWVFTVMAILAWRSSVRENAKIRQARADFTPLVKFLVKLFYKIDDLNAEIDSFNKRFTPTSTGKVWQDMMIHLMFIDLDGIREDYQRFLNQMGDFAKRPDLQEVCEFINSDETNSFGTLLAAMLPEE